MTVTGANSYGAPYMSTQKFYSSLLLNNQSPSENTNTSYTVTVTSSNSFFGGSSITNVTAGSVKVPIASGSYNNLSTYLGINAPGSGYSNCTSTSSTSGSTTTTVYTCTTQYLTTATSATPNCSLYVQTGVTQSYISGLSKSSTAPAAALSSCFSTSGGGAAYAAPTCSQLSALSNQTGSSAIAPAAVFWWDDAGGVGPGEQYYSPSSHCSATSLNWPRIWRRLPVQEQLFRGEMYDERRQRIRLYGSRVDPISEASETPSHVMLFDQRSGLPARRRVVGNTKCKTPLGARIAPVIGHANGAETER